MHGIKYRSDIDGLRAVAVLPVVFFHSGWALFSGGYVGVDIFFVISGYLITGAIRREIEEGSFTVLGFYERRARRIFPALFATILATFVAGLVIFMPDELRDLGSSMAAVSIFASNILFWQQTDYFAGAVELKPLLHTWSLAVEEQFYIFFPLFLLLVARKFGRRYVAPTLVIAALSLILSITTFPLDASGDYYLLPTRAWELLLGALIAYEGFLPIRRRATAELTGVAGMVAIIASILLLNDKSVFPSYNALWPCLGAAAIIHSSGRTPTLVGRLLGSTPFVAVGLISYSLYLVHWPILVFVKYELLRDPTPVEAIVMVSAMIALAALSWRFVERPFRNRHRVSGRTILIASIIAIVATGAVGLGTFAAQGFPQRFPALPKIEPLEISPIYKGCFMKNGWQEWSSDRCRIAHGTGAPVLLWGDSHANHYRDALHDLGPALDRNVLLYVSAACLPVLDVTAHLRPFCRGNNDHALEVIKRLGVKTVILSAYWSREMEGNEVGVDKIAATVARLKAMGVRVKIIGDNPDFTFSNPQFLGYRLSQAPDRGGYFRMKTRNDWALNAKLAALVSPGDFFDPLSALCQDHQCLAAVNGQMLMSDNAHFSEFGAKYVTRKMLPFLRR